MLATRILPVITVLLEKVERGEDLTPHLSLAVWTEGYTPAALSQGPNVDRWADKDFLLNVMGYHHFHLNTTLEPRGFITRSKDVLFAAVSRDLFEVIGIFDHSVFDSDDPNAMSDERRRLWELHEERITRGLPPDSVIVSGPIATSGHSLQVVMMAQDYGRILKDWDRRLDEPEFVRSTLFGAVGVPMPKKPKLSWQFAHFDLGIYDASTGTFFVLRRGPN